MMAIHDLLIRGGPLIDPARGINGRRDVAFRDGVVSAVAERLPEGDAGEVLDVTGAFVTPGLIDLHAHVYHGAVLNSRHADRAALAMGSRPSSTRAARGG